MYCSFVYSLCGKKLKFVIFVMNVTKGSDLVNNFLNCIKLLLEFPLDIWKKQNSDSDIIFKYSACKLFKEFYEAGTVWKVARGWHV